PGQERPAHGVTQVNEELLVLHHRVEISNDGALPLLLFLQPAFDERWRVVAFGFRHRVLRSGQLRVAPASGRPVAPGRSERWLPEAAVASRSRDHPYVAAVLLVLLGPDRREELIRERLLLLHELGREREVGFRN